MSRKEYAIYVITKHGLKIAERIKSVLGDADLYVSKRFIDQAPEGSFELSLPMGRTLKKTFKEFDCHIHIISVCAFVRLIAPLMENKKVDPAIVCVDDAAKFSICVLSGHVGRGNFYTAQVADILDSTPVITTASDVGGTLTVDILGRDLGWALEDMDRNVTRGCAAVVNEEKVLFVQESGEPNWWPIHQKLPKGVEYKTSLENVNPQDYEILLIASERNNIKTTHKDIWENAIIYHPKNIVLGIGCDKDTPYDVVKKGVFHFLEQKNISPKSVKALATIDVKKDEPALLKLKEEFGWKLITYPANQLDNVAGIENPSDVVKKYVGTKSVGEAACLLAADAKKLLMPKQKFNLETGGKNMTLAMAKIEHLPRPGVQ
ncbi:MAG: cobalt-precorrin 5A hydrolase [Bacteriovoracaceae bacterium]